MSDTLDWLCGQLGVDRDFIQSSRKDERIVERRRIIAYFFARYKKSTVWIARLLNKHWSSVNNMLEVISEKEKLRAIELSNKYDNRVANIDELCLDRCLKKINRKEVIEIVCQHFKVSESDIMGKCRTKDVANAKKVLYYVFRRAGLTFYEIGRTLNKDHQTVLMTLDRLDDATLTDYGDLIYDIYCSDSVKERRKEILRLVNEGKSVNDIWKETAYSKDFIKSQIEKFEVKKVPNYQTSEITIKYFLK